MNIYIVKLLGLVITDNETVEKETKTYSTNKEPQLAYFFNLSDAVYFVQNRIDKELNKQGYNFIAILGVPVGELETKPNELYVYRYDHFSDCYSEISDGEAYQFIAKENEVVLFERPVIKLDLSKEEVISTKEFISNLKENIEHKDYGKVKEMIEQKEMSVSNQINGFLNTVSNSLNSVDDAVNKLFDMFNGNF